MRYLSTRGDSENSAKKSFTEILLGGLAPDGGLYLPEAYPQISRALRAMHGCHEGEGIPNQTRDRLIPTGAAIDWRSTSAGQGPRRYAVWQE